MNKHPFLVETFNLSEVDDDEEEDNSIFSLSKKYYELNSLNENSHSNEDTNGTNKEEKINLEVDMKKQIQDLIFNQNYYIENENDLINFVYWPYDIIDSEKEISFLKQKKKEKFKIIRKIKGRHPKVNNSKRKHNSTSFDNLQSKIQVHFFSFIIDISNDALDSYFGKDNAFNFKDIIYAKKKLINFESCSSIKDILDNEISPKYKNFPKDSNKKTLKNLNDLNISWIKEFLNMNYMKLFEIYYNKEKQLKEVFFKGRTIILSENTQVFYDLLIKNETIRSELKDACQRIYFNGYNKKIGKDFFVVKKEILNKE